jgi:hypothetical protein
MRKLLFILILLAIQLNLFSQKLGQGQYWLPLTDKAENKFSLSSPEEFLSQRSLDRRTRQNISLNNEDLPVSKAYLDKIQSLGITILGSSKWFNSVIIESFDTLLLDTLDHYPFVAEFNFNAARKKTLHISESAEKTWSVTGQELSTENLYGKAYAQIAMLNGTALHDMGYRGSNMQIAVIDGGFYNADVYPAFDSLRNESRLLGFRDFSHAVEGFFQTASHGMSVLSTIAANVPGEIIGTAPKASYWLLKSEIVESESPLEEAYWALAAEFADSVGADIITSSLGYSVFDDPSLNYSYSDMDGKTTLVTRAAEKAFSKGLVVVNSAGNEGNKAWKHLIAPSDGPDVLCIGASDTSGNIASFSSRGPSSDKRVKPDVIAVGYKTVVVNSSGAVSEGFGTSFSAPQVAGMVACLWEAAPGKTNLEIIQSVRKSASRYFSPTDSTGYGIPDFLKSLFILKSDVPLIEANQLTIVPNPNYGVFEIRSEIFPREELRIDIYDVQGRKIFSGNKTFNAGFVRVDELEGQSSGLYYVVAESKAKRYFANILILKP